MRKMILAEVQRFRQAVRMQQPQQAQMSQIQQQQQGNVPIPDNAGKWSQEDPRPQEAMMAHGQQVHGEMDLNQVLQGGLDAMHQ